ncbi:MAG TPA: hypothetical protein PKA60_02545 [Candidatus Paceibacterota bacterium]|nr:hypothetical protein [Candidatus Paceibacterota bacterium]
MKIYKTLFVIGLLVLLTPFFGFPSSFEVILNIIFGSFLILMAISIKLKKIYQHHSEMESNPKNNSFDTNRTDSISDTEDVILENISSNDSDIDFTNENSIINEQEQDQK